MILTSNCGFAEWGEVFGDPVVATALLDRLLHHAVVIQIEGSSYRLRQHADLMPEHVRSKAAINAPIPASRHAAAAGHPKMELRSSRPADHRKPARLRNFTSAHLRKFEPALTAEDGRRRDNKCQSNGARHRDSHSRLRGRGKPIKRHAITDMRSH